jgi:hypothetical protein
MVPKILFYKQNDCRWQICINIFRRMGSEPNLLKKVITCDETWIFQYDPETKRRAGNLSHCQKWIKLEWSRQNKGHIYHFFLILRGDFNWMSTTWTNFKSTLLFTNLGCSQRKSKKKATSIKKNRIVDFASRKWTGS